jgi:3-dehydroquinate synthase
LIKTKVVKADEFEQADRKLLNFGHTLGHAIENIYELSHGQAISIGMTYAALISQELNGFAQTTELVQVFEKYGLPTFAKFNTKKALKILQMDKKKSRQGIQYILLDKIGKASIHYLSFDQLQQIFQQF